MKHRKASRLSEEEKLRAENQALHQAAENLLSEIVTLLRPRIKDAVLQALLEKWPPNRPAQRGPSHE